jgi:small multidrug resistance pump
VAGWVSIQAWLALLLAIAAQVTGTALPKLSAGLTRPGPTICLLAAYACAIALDSRVVTVIPLGITYALWSGIDPLAYRQSPDRVQLFGVAFIVAGGVMVNLGGGITAERF